MDQQNQQGAAESVAQEKRKRKTVVKFDSLELLAAFEAPSRYHRAYIVIAPDKSESFFSAINPEKVMAFIADALGYRSKLAKGRARKATSVDEIDVEGMSEDDRKALLDRLMNKPLPNLGDVPGQTLLGEAPPAPASSPTPADKLTGTPDAMRNPEAAGGERPSERAARRAQGGKARKGGSGRKPPKDSDAGGDAAAAHAAKK